MQTDEGAEGYQLACSTGCSVRSSSPSVVWLLAHCLAIVQRGCQSRNVSSDRTRTKNVYTNRSARVHREAQNSFSGRERCNGNSGSINVTFNGTYYERCNLPPSQYRRAKPVRFRVGGSGIGLPYLGRPASLRTNRSRTASTSAFGAFFNRSNSSGSISGRSTLAIAFVTFQIPFISFGLFRSYPGVQFGP